MDTVKKIVIKPLITEKTIMMAEKLKKYTFMVSSEAEKIEIGKAVAAKFNVTVVDVNTINMLGKLVHFGKKRSEGRRSNFKKAVVSLKEGDKISLFEIK